MKKFLLMMLLVLMSKHSYASVVSFNDSEWVNPWGDDSAIVGDSSIDFDTTFFANAEMYGFDSFNLTAVDKLTFDIVQTCCDS